MMKAPWTNRYAKPLIRLLGVIALLALGACGGGGTGGTNSTPIVPALVVSPASATLVAGVATRFTITSGTAPYTIVSSVPSLVPNPTVDSLGQFSVTATSLPATSTLVTLTVTDGAGKTASVTVTVNAGNLSVSPSSAILQAGVAATFTISDGNAPYTITSSLPSLVPSPTSVDANGRFTVTAVSIPAETTAVTLTVTDAQKSVVTVQLSVVGGALTVTPASADLDIGVPVTFTISNGTAPYTITSSVPSLVPSPTVVDANGRFTAVAVSQPAVSTPVTLTITDARGSRVTVSLSVGGQPLNVLPGTATLELNIPVTFTITGGAKPYTVISSLPSLVPNPTSIGTDGRFSIASVSVPNTSTPVQITVRDARQTTVTTTVTVNGRQLAVSPGTISVLPGQPATFTVSGGVKPYSVISSLPNVVPAPTSIDADGRFTVIPASGFAGQSVLLTIRDTQGNSTTASVTVQPLALAISPDSVRTIPGVDVRFTITGGQKPYQVSSSFPSLVPAPASIDDQGRFTVRALTIPASTADVLLQVRDAAQNTVTATVTVTNPTLAVFPVSASAYSGTPLTLTISGGTPPYKAFSSNAVVLPVAQNVVTNQVLLNPANVDADTSVTVTITDSSGGQVTAAISVKPAPLLNLLTVTPTPATPGSGCGSAVCAGQTASVTVKVRNVAGAGIQGRAVKFENVQGNYQFLTNGPGLPESLANTITVSSGQDGLAVVRLKADVNAPTQVALIRVTELATGNVLNSSFEIAQFTDGAGTLTAIPTSWSMKGPDSSNCAANLPVSYYIFGGTPPYRIQSTLPNYANIVPTLVQTNGGGFTAIVTGMVCSPSPGTSITITDATGRTITVTLINDVGTGNPITNSTGISIIPGDIVTPILACGQSITEQIVGGDLRSADGSLTAGTFTVSTANPGVTATLSGKNIVITRTTGTTNSPAVIVVSNGYQTVTFSVAVEAQCSSTTPTQSIFFTPSPLPIACASGKSAQTIISVAGPFTAVTGTGLTVAFGGISGTTMTVTRTAAVLAGSPSIPVYVTTGTGAIGTLMVAPTTDCN